MLRKPRALRAALLDRIDVLRAEPANLSMFIDKGRILSRATASHSFQYRYTLNLVVQDYAGDIDALMLPILLWLRAEEPELFDRAPQEPLHYESEILDGDAADVSIYIELSERVIVDPTDTGDYRVRHLGDANPSDSFGPTPSAPLMQLSTQADPAEPSP